MMNRNTSSRFSIAPQVDIQRSTFNRDSSIKTSFDVGRLVPFYVDEVLPGDTFKVKTSKVARMQTLKTPMMDDIFIDTYYFFCPSRILWDHFVNFYGENSDSAWIPDVEYTIPQISAPEGGWNVGTIADYLGIPTGVDNICVNALPFRAVARCWNEWFRDENLQDPLVIESGDSSVSGSNGDHYVTDVALGGLPPFACKTHDYFTSCLPSPQKGPEVQINSLSAPSLLPVYSSAFPNEHFWNQEGSAAGLAGYQNSIKTAYPLMYEKMNPNLANNTPHPLFEQITKSPTDSGWLAYAVNGQTNSPYRSIYQGNATSGQDPITNTSLKSYFDSTSANDYQLITPVNLVAESSGKYLFTSINDLRQAFQIQRYFEKCARGGTRFREILAAHFGVSLGDVRAMIPEYLGGNRINVNVRQITQTSSTTSDSPLGDVAAMSVTTDNHFDFEKSFTEPGYLIGFMVARYHHTYQQGIDPLFQRKGVFDFYWPSFAHLGEQAVKNRTIFAQGYDLDDPDAVDYDDQVFGYQEAWAEYRYKPNRVSGLMRSSANGSLDSWHLADYYSVLPMLSDEWIREDPSNVDRVLSVTSNVSNQIFADVFVKNTTTRPMPLYSIPGLIDHF